MGLRLPGLGAAWLCLMLCACTGGTTEAASWPSGTVLVVDGVPIQATEVDAHIDALLDIKPAFKITHRRRLIVMNWSLPMAYGIAQAGPAREEARQRAEAWLASRANAPRTPLEPADDDMLGNWYTLGVEIWLVARELEQGECSGVVELPGRYVVVDMVVRDHDSDLAQEQMALRVETFPYVDHPTALTADCSNATLEIVDPTWREIVPGFYKYKMQGEQK